MARKYLRLSKQVQSQDTTTSDTTAEHVNVVEEEESAVAILPAEYLVDYKAAAAQENWREILLL